MLKINDHNRLFRKPFLLFSPFLVFFAVLAIIFPTNGVSGDENRYLQYAKNIIQGYYANPDKGIYLDNGPGYPILLAPFIGMRLPLISITLLNAVLQYLSIVILFKALRKVVSLRISLIFSFFWALYFHAYHNISFVHTEVLTSFLVTVLILAILNAFKSTDKKESRKYVYLAGFIIGYIALTKNIFGYVIMTALFGSIVFFLFNRKSIDYKKTILIFLIAFITTSPYLVYSFNFSGRLFYWGSLGGVNLYWMTTQYNEEYGSWYPDNVLTKPDSYSEPFLIPGSGKLVKENHQKDLTEILQYKGIEQDDAYKRVAIRNIRSHPVKYLQNCFSNVGRLLFGMPNSYMIQRPGNLLNLPFNGIIVLLLLFCVFPMVRSWKKLIYAVKILLFFVFIYLGGSILLNADMDMFTIIVPILLFIIAYIIERSLKLILKFNDNNVKL